MYLLKNAFKNITRSKGKNILIGIIITVITTCTCISLAINKAASNLVNSYKTKNPLEVSFNLDMSNLRSATDSEKENFKSLTVDNIKSYGDSNLVKDYYYTLETSINSNDVTAIEDNKKTNADNYNNNEIKDDNHKKFDNSNMGNFRLTAYSNFAYLDDFTTGNKKIIEGKMITGDSNTNEIVISKDLKDENNLELNQEITFTNPSDDEKSYTFKIVGIYENEASSSTSNFMDMNVLNSANQIYANLNSIQKVLDDNSSNDENKLVRNNGLTAKFYLNKNSDLKKFKKEVRKKGLSSYYEVSTNESEILETLKPIQNISTFSINFLIVIIVIGIVVLTIINFLNIRDRKYEIGVLRAIGMSKFKVTLQLVLETFFVAFASLIIGTAVGIISSQPVTNYMLKNEINSYREEVENTTNNFKDNNFQRPSESMKDNSIRKDKPKVNRNIDYVDSLKVHIDILTIIELFGVCILLTATSVITVSLIINKYSPNKILQNRL